MLRRITAWIAARLGRIVTPADGDAADGDAADGDSADGKSGGSRFVPSPLDVSVRVAHGGSTAEIDRELADVDRQARELADGRQRD